MTKSRQKKQQKQRTPEQSRLAILGLTTNLKQYLVGRDEVIDLLALCMTASEPMLLLGPPGTAKSDVLTKFSQAIGLGKGDYFEYMVTAFTEPSELLGPVDIKALRESGTYKRCLDGKLADATIVFLDEIFNGNSAILNTLLTVMNEKKIYDGGKPYRLDKLIGFFAATNQIPDREELAALKDRFLVKVELAPVQKKSFDDLVQAGVKNDLWAATQQRPWERAGEVSVADFVNVRNHVTKLLLDRYDKDPETARFPLEVHRTFRRLVFALTDSGVEISDREVVKLYRMIIIFGYLFHGRAPDTIQLSDLSLLRYVAESSEQFPVVQKIVDETLRGGS